MTTLQEEIEALKAKARARRGKAGYEKNVEAIEAKIARLQRQLEEEQ